MNGVLVLKQGLEHAKAGRDSAVPKHVWAGSSP